MAANKTNANDANRLAHLGFYLEVKVKGFDSMLTRTLVAASTRLVTIQTELSNQIGGLMKTFGLVALADKGSSCEKNVCGRLDEDHELATIIRPLVEALSSVRLRAAELTRRMIDDARQSEACQLLMPIPGAGVVIASAFATALENPANFRSSRSVAAWLRLTTRRYQSGQSTIIAISPDAVITRSGASLTRRPA